MSEHPVGWESIGSCTYDKLIATSLFYVFADLPTVQHALDELVFFNNFTKSLLFREV